MKRRLWVVEGRDPNTGAWGALTWVYRSRALARVGRSSMRTFVDAELRVVPYIPEPKRGKR